MASGLARKVFLGLHTGRCHRFNMYISRKYCPIIPHFHNLCKILVITTRGGIAVLEILLSAKSPFEVLAGIRHQFLILLFILLLVTNSCKLFLFLLRGGSVKCVGDEATFDHLLVNVPRLLTLFFRLPCAILIGPLSMNRRKHHSITQCTCAVVPEDMLIRYYLARASGRVKSMQVSP
jgi:hypothetical protein